MSHSAAGERTPFDTLTRLGFASRALMYAATGFLILRLGRTEDNLGALRFLDSSFGGVLLGTMAVGFLGYGAWRLFEAVTDTEGHGSGAAGILARVGGAGSGLIHLGLCWIAARLASGLEPSGDAASAERAAALAMSMPGGVALLYLGAAVLLAAGVVQLARAVKCAFLRFLDPHIAAKAWVLWAGRLGYLARGVVFVATGLLIGRAAWLDSARAAGGTEQALDSFPETIRLLVAAGLLIFGAFSLVEAIYRRIHDPEVLDRLKRFTPS
ncbi:hypothetical protein GGR88_002260 [Sphingomonas jejuensis]|uniref:DUF1206 domain-containing protein n=1 Tax=Sphingomonas jejuensis TaxID=904715 RepID=A0ABX0XPX6_9SPHN|nr:DUF1206 domain-containing protein [Sphingomonas jejuensis]NJC34746.1 hypothetical protein [Sphingomonas jejuensis]